MEKQNFCMTMLIIILIFGSMYTFVISNYNLVLKCCAYSSMRDDYGTNLEHTIGSFHYAKKEIIYDDFTSLNTTMWEKWPSYAAYPKSDGENLVLTSANSDGGIVWLKEEITTNFEAEFSFYIGNGSGADGLVFMFFKGKDYTPAYGGYLCFSDDQSQTHGDDGFGVEIDTYGNEFDPYGEATDDNAGHIAIIKDTATNHITSHQVARSILRNAWHTLKVVVFENHALIWFDDEPILNYTNNILLNREHSGIGFAASTGDLADMHMIGYFKLWEISAADYENSYSQEASNFSEENIIWIILVLIFVIGASSIVIKKKRITIKKHLKVKKFTDKSISQKSIDFNKILTTFLEKNEEITKEILDQVDSKYRKSFGKWLAEHLVAKNEYNRAKEILIAIGDYDSLVTIMISKAILKRSQGKVKEAKSIYFEIAELLQKIGEKKRAKEILEYAKDL